MSATDDTTVAPTAAVAWRVEINCMSCIVFASTKAKAQWTAVKGYRDAYGERKGEWPRAKAHRLPIYDNSPIRNNPHQQAWSEDYVIGYPHGGAN